MRRRSITVAIVPTISPPSHVFSLCKCAREDKGGERGREPISLASLRMTHRAAEKPSIHPATCFHIPPSHLSLPSSLARGKIAQLAEAITERRGAAAGNPFSLSSPPRSTFLGRRSSHSFPPSPRPVRSRRWMGRCEGCFVRVRLSGVVLSMTHPPLPTYPPSHPFHPMPSVKGLGSTLQ